MSCNCYILYLQKKQDLSVLQTNGSGVLSFSSVSTDIKAWVQFNGIGTVSIRASFNVSSITDNAVGKYTINFTNSLTDANYSTVGMTQEDTGGGARIISGVGTPTASARPVNTTNALGNDQDHLYTNLAFFR